MGMQQSVVFEGPVPAWSAVCESLRQAGCEVPGMRMIDGEIALPDEEPGDGWHELRVAWPDGSGMVTVQRGAPGRVELIVWGNADTALRRGWCWLAWALASAGDGEVEAEGQRYDADAYARAMSLSV